VYSGEALYVRDKKFTEQKQIQEHLLLDGILNFTATSAHQHRKATVLRKREDSACNNPILETEDCLCFRVFCCRRPCDITGSWFLRFLSST